MFTGGVITGEGGLKLVITDSEHASEEDAWASMDQAENAVVDLITGTVLIDGCCAVGKCSDVTQAVAIASETVLTTCEAHRDEGFDHVLEINELGMELGLPVRVGSRGGALLRRGIEQMRSALWAETVAEVKADLATMLGNRSWYPMLRQQLAGTDGEAVRVGLFDAVRELTPEAALEKMDELFELGAELPEQTRSELRDRLAARDPVASRLGIM